MHHSRPPCAGAVMAEPKIVGIFIPISVEDHTGGSIGLMVEHCEPLCAQYAQPRWYVHGNVHTIHNHHVAPVHSHFVCPTCAFKVYLTLSLFVQCISICSLIGNKLDFLPR